MTLLKMIKIGSFFLLKVKIRQSGRSHYSKSDGGGCKVDIKLQNQTFLTYLSLPLNGLQGFMTNIALIHLPDSQQPV